MDRRPSPVRRTTGRAGYPHQPSFRVPRVLVVPNQGLGEETVDLEPSAEFESLTSSSQPIADEAALEAQQREDTPPNRGGRPAAQETYFLR
jgi:hypothetical protein